MLAELLPTPALLLERLALAGLAIGWTIALYLAARRIQRRCRGAAALHPVLVSVVLGAALLLLGGVSYQAYFANAYPMHALLGPMTALLAVPLIRQTPRILRSAKALSLSLLVGCAAALVTTALFVRSAGADALMATLLPKSTTTAIAVALSEIGGGAPGLTAVVVILTGVFGAAFGPGLLRAARISDDRAVGLALGVSAHLLGTARAFQVSETAGAFAAIGAILNGLATAAVLCAIALLSP